MKAPQNASRLNQVWALPVRAERPLAMFLAVTMAAFAPMNFAAQASEPSATLKFRQVLSTSRLRRVTTVWLRAIVSALSCSTSRSFPGDFIIDGGGGILLPLAGSVSLKGLTLAEAQQLIQDRFADGVLVQPAVSVRITEYRPIFVTGSVRKPGSYRFMFGESVKAAIATAGGKGQPLSRPSSVAVSDYITAEQRVRQLEADRATLLMRKARLEAQRDGRENFVMPVLVGFSLHNVDFDRAYSTENDTFLRLADTYRRQIEALQKQRPRIEAETDAVTDQIAKQKERLGIVNSRLADLELTLRQRAFA